MDAENFNGMDTSRSERNIFIANVNELIDKEKGILGSAPQAIREVQRKESQHDGSQRSKVHSGLGENGHFAPCNTGKKNVYLLANRQDIVNSSNRQACSSFAEIRNRDNRNGITIGAEPRNEHAFRKGREFHACHESHGHKKQLHNDFSSPNNTSRCGNVAKDGILGKLPCKELPDESDMHIKIPWSEERSSSEGKGKVVSSEMAKPESLATKSDSEFGVHRQQNQTTGKRKYGSVHSNFGQSSSSFFESLETSSGQVYGQKSPIPNRFHNFTQGQHFSNWASLRNVDVLNSEEVRHSSFRTEDDSDSRICQVESDDRDSRICQVESDEILARQLQEQFLQEAQSSVGTEEVDATTAWISQQDDAQHARSFARQAHSLERDQPMVDLSSDSQLFPFSSAQQNHRPVPESGRRIHLRNFNCAEMDQEMTIIAQLRRGFSSNKMDLEMRVNFLEALEAAFESSNDMAFSDDFFPDIWNYDDDDYDALSAIDDKNPLYAGASDSQINSLPLSTVQRGNLEDVCTICLDSPCVGDVIRHLPCLHKFHKECIDAWLRRRTSCPVCKSVIT
ncbi:uncharacterized protein LOC109729031 [Ananas comosus]|uniref:Uncharacterized protein LOC109729031 n=1 Tax=Ananas comosus TaxID=4615 RepID=A0A6P5H2Q3_ANACO|nr:uncharacterized protein LOC109729031 [Ananas comosus]